jgi:hypothetical protein
MAYGGTRDAPDQVARVVFRDNLVRHNAYGVHGAERAIGMDTLDAYFPGIVFFDEWHRWRRIETLSVGQSVRQRFGFRAAVRRPGLR